MNVAALWGNPTALVAALLGLGLGLLVGPSPIAGVVLLVLAAGAAIVLTRPDLVLLAMIAVLPWENMLHYPSATLSTVKGIGAAVLIAFLVQICSDRRKVIHLPALVAIVTGLGIWIGVCLIFSTYPSVGVQKLARWALFLTFLFLIVQMVDGRREIERVLRCFALSVGAAAAYTLWLFIGGHTGFRAAGPLEDPNDLAYLMACTLPIAAYLFKIDRSRRPLWALCFALSTGAMLATFSRGALVGVAALLLWGIVTRRIPFRAILVGLLTGVVLVALAFTVWKPFFDDALAQKEHVAQSNVESREARWSAALQLAGESPLVGVGTGLYPIKAQPILRDDRGSLPAVTVPVTVAHNTYLEILAENGIPGLALFVAYLLVVWSLLRRSQHWAEAAGDERGLWLTTALQASIVIAIVAATFLSEELTPPFWLLGGLAAVLARDVVGASVPADPAPSLAAVSPAPAVGAPA
jgi:putative inorganic carbon (hco3(-)) transporter